jgi:DNA polymerase III delta prime subunit
MELTDLIHYKIAYQLYFFFKNKNHPNLILYGCKYSGKTTLIKTLLSHIYTSEIKKKETTDFSVSLNNSYYYFNCASIQNKSAFLDYFKEIILTYNYYHSQSKYIILDHFEEAGGTIQNSLKVMIEKACYSSKIIILTNKFNKVICPIKSRCISMRVPSMTQSDKYIYIKEYMINKNIPVNAFIIMNKCKVSELHEIINEFTIDNYRNIKMTIYQEMKEAIMWDIIDVEKLNKMRKMSSTIKELNIRFSELLKQFICEYEMVNISMIKECAENEYLLGNSYRSLIHIDHLLLNLNLMIHK